jgi:CubicO group peptidase (beta-lactamase class C family)
VIRWAPATSKVFTATALACAVTTGDIALDEPVLHHITYRHLATHTAGLPRGVVGLLDALQAVPGAGFEYPLGAPSGGLYGTIADLLVFVRQYLTPDAARRLAVTDRLCWMVDGERVWQYRDVRGRSRRRCALRAQAYRWPRPPCQDRLNSVTGSGSPAAANRFR